jgi:hypothetical protein
MRSLILALSLLSANAYADTIGLLISAGAGCLHQYHSVGNTAGMQIDIYGPNNSTFKGLNVYLDGDWGNPFATPLYMRGVPMVLYQPTTGLSLVLTMDETSVTYAVNSGRAHYTCTQWTLQDGTIVR